MSICCHLATAFPQDCDQSKQKIPRDHQSAKQWDDALVLFGLKANGYFGKLERDQEGAALEKPPTQKEGNWVSRSRGSHYHGQNQQGFRNTSGFSQTSHLQRGFKREHLADPGAVAQALLL